MVNQPVDHCSMNEVPNAYKYEARIESEVDRLPKHVTADSKTWPSEALESNTEYVIQIRAVSGYEEVPNSKWSEIISVRRRMRPTWCDGNW